MIYDLSKYPSMMHKKISLFKHFIKYFEKASQKALPALAKPENDDFLENIMI